ncbi:MAG: type II toxin-antitoxin system RelE/ParE family toxin [Chloroflexi bacterium]|nr:type II toxin-antitoxin system RelE/ParE family toxin [Chloroflexota bacterium]MDA1218655.1 type II toxin-antitoxin system RelE/ParE family toxin [Chloroflexota bacterium]PKB57239.1 MAG: hypothetical protein BZY73_04280 [SAR202 cluster bacterium Casp-Chloro-G3]
MIVQWSHTAIAHLVGIYDYISRDSSLYAQRTIDRLIRRVEQISLHPQSGRAVPEYQSQNIREIISSPYRIIYRMTENHLEALAFVHGRQALRLDE